MYVTQSRGTGKGPPPPPPAESVGMRVRRYRIAAGLTQVQLAAKVGVSQGKVSNVERDTTSLEYYEAVRFADELHTQVEVLMPKLARPKAKRENSHPRSEYSGPAEVHPMVHASLESYLERKGALLSEPVKLRLPIMARGIDPHDKNVKLGDALWDAYVRLIFDLYTDDEAS